MKIPKGHNHETFKLGYEQGKMDVLKELSKLKEEVIPQIINADWIQTKTEVGHCYESEIINELLRKFNYSECDFQMSSEEQEAEE